MDKGKRLCGGDEGAERVDEERPGDITASTKNTFKFNCCLGRATLSATVGVNIVQALIAKHWTVCSVSLQ